MSHPRRAKILVLVDGFVEPYPLKPMPDCTHFPALAMGNALVALNLSMAPSSKLKKVSKPLSLRGSVLAAPSGKVVDVAKEMNLEERKHDAVGGRAGAGASIVWEKQTAVLERGEEGEGTDEEAEEEGACSDRGAGT